MADGESILKNRFKDLYNRSNNRGIYCYSDFLNMHEQGVLYSELKYGYTLFGGYPDAERKIAIFGNEENCGYSEQPPIKIICVSPLSQKFSDDLTHRDFLGSLMGLGIKREALGDIIITENKGYIFCLDGIADYITENLTKVRHTSVSAAFCEELPETALPKPKEKVVTVSSHRVDVLISAVYNISRSKSSALVEGEKVFINGKPVINISKSVETGDIVSVRGYGRFKLCRLLGESKKGKLRIKCDVF